MQPDEIVSEVVKRYPDLSRCASSIERAFGVLARCYWRSGKLLVCGNGGSAADSEHIVGELMKCFKMARPLRKGFADAYRAANEGDAPPWLEGALPAISLVSQISLMTAFSNDESAAGVFAQQVYGYGHKGDVLLAISTSGNSANVVEAAKVAKALGLKVIVLTGEAESRLSEIADVAIRVPRREVHQIQELHLPVYHALCAALEAEFFAEAPVAYSAVREAVVLAGGKGTRLRSVVPDVPKPMASVAGRPFLCHVFDMLRSKGVERIVVAIGYMGDTIRSYFGDSFQGMELVYSEETAPLGTGGAVKRALGLVRGPWAYVLNGDTYQEIDPDAFIAASCHARTKAIIGVRYVSRGDRYGTLETDDGGLITCFSEKLRDAAGLMNAGAYLMRKDALYGMPDIFSLEKDWLEPGAGTGMLGTARMSGGFVDIGVPEDYVRAQTMGEFQPKSRRIAFFDRDGTINIDTGHLHEPDKLALVSGTAQLIRHHNERGDVVAVVTNQAGIAKGLYGETEMRRLHKALDFALAEEGANIDAYYFCPHHPDFTGECSCRKPAPGMLLRGLWEFDANPDECVMYGDKETDMRAAQAAGVRFRWISDALEDAQEKG